MRLQSLREKYKRREDKEILEGGGRAATHGMQQMVEFLGKLLGTKSLPFESLEYKPNSALENLSAPVSQN